MRTGALVQAVTREVSRFPYKERLHMPGSLTTAVRPGTRDDAPVRVAFRGGYRVSVPGRVVFGAQWLAYALPCRRFAVVLTANAARRGADVVRYFLHRSGLAPPTLCRSPGAHPA